MNNKNFFIEKWHKSSITFKVFLTTSLLLILLSLFIYFSLYFFLPSFYKDHKISQLEKEIELLLIETAELPLSESLSLLDDFSHEQNVEMLLFSPDEYLIQKFPIYTVWISELISEIEVNERIIDNEVDENSINISAEEFELFLPFETGTQYMEEYFNSTKFAEDHTLYYTLTLQPVGEVSDILFLFIPYISIIILIFTVISVSFYSKTITKPLLEINKRAKKMADLDFNETWVVNSEDEIGQLSNSLNQMSNNLQKSMSDLKNANTQLVSDIQRKQEEEKKRSEFVATISHELKTPITAVKGQIEAMISNIGPYKDHDKYLRRSYKIMSDMEGLVKEVLNVSKWEYHEVQKEYINLTDLIKKCNENLDYFYKEKEITLILELVEVKAWVDSSLINKAVGNIISNAVNYSPQGAMIHISLTIQDQHPVLRVFNSDTTISEQEIDKIFEPFYRLEKSRNRSTGGSGLGLYIVQQILDLHHVDYHIKNVDGGVAFTIIFPKSHS